MFTWNKTWEVSWFKIGLGLEKKWRIPFSCRRKIISIGLDLSYEGGPRLTLILSAELNHALTTSSPPIPMRIIKHGGLRSTLSQASQPNCYHEWCLFRTLSYPCSLKKCTGVKYTIFISSTPLFADFDQYSRLTVFLGRISNLGYPPGLLNV